MVAIPWHGVDNGWRILPEPRGILQKGPRTPRAMLADTLHVSLDALEAGLDEIRCSPRDTGTLAWIVRRPAVDAREVVTEGRLDLVEGLVGDNWIDRGNSHMPGGVADPERQLTLMNVRAADLVAGTPERRALAGDQLYVEFDLGEANLPAGARLAVGEAVVEISAVPHTGCAKFKARFGRDALRLVSTPEGRALRLRGANAKVVVPGVIRVGDTVRKVTKYE